MGARRSFLDDKSWSVGEVRVGLSDYSWTPTMSTMPTTRLPGGTR
jgi:hypothetical protein